MNKQAQKKKNTLLTVLVMCGFLAFSNIVLCERMHHDDFKSDSSLWTRNNILEIATVNWTKNDLGVDGTLHHIGQQIDALANQLSQRAQIVYNASQLAQDSFHLDTQEDLKNQLENLGIPNLLGGKHAKDGVVEIEVLRSYLSMCSKHLIDVQRVLISGEEEISIAKISGNKALRLFNDWQKAKSSNDKEEIENALFFELAFLERLEEKKLYYHAKEVEIKELTKMVNNEKEDRKKEKIENEENTLFKRFYEIAIWPLEIPSIVQQQYLDSFSWYNFLLATTSGKSILAASVITSAVFIVKKKKDSIRSLLRRIIKGKERDEQKEEELDDLFSKFEF